MGVNATKTVVQADQRISIDPYMGICCCWQPCHHRATHVIRRGGNRAFAVTCFWHMEATIEKLRQQGSQNPGE